ncbi:MAG: hypothetical protein ABI472_09975 [Ginsengibacter sp.]
MKRILLLLILQIFVASIARCQSFTVRDLVTLASQPSQNISHFMYRNGFVSDNSNSEPGTIAASFTQKIKSKKNYDGPLRSVDLFEKQDAKYFIFHTSSLQEYLDGAQRLIKSGFAFDKAVNRNPDTPMLFQKANISIEAIKELVDSNTRYTFTLKEKRIPDSIAYAEDLLQFDSREFLASYFGEKNVREDLYYFSEKELKKCSVLFSGTKYQAAFIWGDENNFANLSYIVVSNVLPTKGGERNGLLEENNAWKFRSGIHSGMRIKDLLRLNEMDFDMYGNKSDLAFMVKPGSAGKIDFKKTAIMFRCINCYDNKIFDQPEISALDIAKANLPLNVFDIIIYPSER